MKSTKVLLATTLGMMFFIAGCTVSDEAVQIEGEATYTPRTDLTTQTITDTDGNEIVVQSSNTQTVKGKEATIRTPQTFEKVEDSTLIIEEHMTTVSALVKSSTITIENGAVFHAKYVKNSKIIVKKGGDLQITERMKNSEIILEGGTFSVKPDMIDESSKITTQ